MTLINDMRGNLRPESSDWLFTSPLYDMTNINQILHDESDQMKGIFTDSTMPLALAKIVKCMLIRAICLFLSSFPLKRSTINAVDLGLFASVRYLLIQSTVSMAYLTCRLRFIGRRRQAVQDTI